jgi:hypothetical protein
MPLLLVLVSSEIKRQTQSFFVIHKLLPAPLWTRSIPMKAGTFPKVLKFELNFY